MIKKNFEAIIGKSKYDRWEEKELFLHIPSESFKDFVVSLVKRFNTRLTSISALEHNRHFELFYHLVVNNIPLNVITEISKDLSTFQSISGIVINAAPYEKELLDIFKQRG